MKTTFLSAFLCVCVLIGMEKNSFAGLNEESNTFRCDNGLVSINDSFHEVRQKCGEPQSAGQGVWVYDFGSGDFVYMIEFQSGRVNRIINTGNYGNAGKTKRNR